MTDAQSTLDLAKSSLEPDSQPITIPPLVQSFCDFVLHFLPTLVDADASQEYLSGINLHVILSLLRKVAVATRTDVLVSCPLQVLLIMLALFDVLEYGI